MWQLSVCERLVSVLGSGGYLPLTVKVKIVVGMVQSFVQVPAVELWSRMAW